ncbi:MAG: hypothetical protein MZW92_79585 [Comamonadaceae bacterium]|nr:hypothetical protein [Comamonadaceae bacterium]
MRRGAGPCRRCAAPTSCSTPPTALAALDALRDRLPVTMQDIRRGLLEVELAGALPGAARAARRRPRRRPQPAGRQACWPTTWATCGFFDRDAGGVRHAAPTRTSPAWSRHCAAGSMRWLACTLEGPRAHGRRGAGRHRCCRRACRPIGVQRFDVAGERLRGGQGAARRK